MEEQKEKPSFSLLRGDAGLDEIFALFRHLTGREPSMEEIEEARGIWSEEKQSNPQERE